MGEPTRLAVWPPGHRCSDMSRPCTSPPPPCLPTLSAAHGTAFPNPPILELCCTVPPGTVCNACHGCDCCGVSQGAMMTKGLWVAGRVCTAQGKDLPGDPTTRGQPPLPGRVCIHPGSIDSWHHGLARHDLLPCHRQPPSPRPEKRPPARPRREPHPASSYMPRALGSSCDMEGGDTGDRNWQHLTMFHVETRQLRSLNTMC